MRFAIKVKTNLTKELYRFERTHSVILRKENEAYQQSHGKRTLMDDLKNLNSEDDEAEPEEDEGRKKETNDNFHRNNMTLNKNKLFDKTCSICTDDFQNNE